MHGQASHSLSRLLCFEYSYVPILVSFPSFRSAAELPPILLYRTCWRYLTTRLITQRQAETRRLGNNTKRPPSPRELLASYGYTSTRGYPYSTSCPCSPSLGAASSLISPAFGKIVFPSLMRLLWVLRVSCQASPRTSSPARDMNQAPPCHQ
ncbi:hypothetical protein J3F84DRAFT_373582 [Trichoderma pleuroticola]